MNATLHIWLVNTRKFSCYKNATSTHKQRSKFVNILSFLSHILSVFPIPLCAVYSLYGLKSVQCAFITLESVLRKRTKRTWKYSILLPPRTRRHDIYATAAEFMLLIFIQFNTYWLFHALRLWEIHKIFIYWFLFLSFWFPFWFWWIQRIQEAFCMPHFLAQIFQQFLTLNTGRNFFSSNLTVLQEKKVYFSKEKCMCITSILAFFIIKNNFRFMPQIR